jgi:hypothetical protein
MRHSVAMKIKYQDPFRCRDTGLACVLLSLNQKLVDVSWVADTCFFDFEDGQQCRELEIAFHRDELEVNPKTFLRLHKLLMDRMFDARRQGSASGR